MNQQHSTPDWMLYGANGYTGEMIAREAARRGLRPVLAGRNRDKVESLARELGLEARVFDLDRPGEVARQVDGQTLVMHCAGPFSATAAPMMEACLGAGAHYLDISGEIAVFEHARSLDERARQAGITICPGVGFDVIPTDCVAAALKAALPDATHLALGFDSSSSFSPGTAKTLVEGMPQGGKVRRDGRIVTVPLAHGVRRIDFGNGEKNAMTIPWGDVSTAYATTGIPNIEVFIPASAGMVLGARLGNLVRPLLGLRAVQDLLKARIGRTVTGPDARRRAGQATYVWGEVRNARGERRTARVRTDHVYSLTVNGALAVVDHLMRTPPAGGAYTPSRLIGAGLVSSLPGSGPLEIV
ncbi:saccharopine dehydrogenase NADP-binding domain-containing protein [Burkholderia sp. Cy-637]|uniref:saccharopine dehydrogenase family protein n=1 Tax=Burkholderia sp. Cy-637 TaxID=2608327 RepID=UPI0014204A7D|nr:saccharopine dehydrogenase NADP-binding domain-containing protein [Burkholderia sp. Cy-637]NIF89731.1 NAD(P)H-binding protein [Burkholderia sp. Cy-637]